MIDYKKEIIPVIKWLAIDLFEVVVDIQLSNGLLFNTIEWRKEKNKKEGEVYVGAIGGAYSFCFTPTGLGNMVVVKCADGTELDLTEYEYW